jgi:hypothetical protein
MRTTLTAASFALALLSALVAPPQAHADQFPGTSAPICEEIIPFGYTAVPGISGDGTTGPTVPFTCGQKA